MNLDVDNIIMFFDKLAGQESTDKEEMEEQETAAPSSSTGGGSIPKWADSYPIKVGKANPRMKSGQKWETGIDRTGPANKIW
jgi:hypothetical protein